MLYVAYTMVSSTPSATLRALLGHPDLALRDLSGPTLADRLDQSIQWVHSSDLADPTPFLVENMVLLTTGTQFTGQDAVPSEDYVSRLVTRGVVALGFGTEVVRAGVPDALVQACAQHRLVLFEVPYRTAFIAIARVVADAIAAEVYARRTAVVSAQRAIALAALRRDGLGAAIAELSRQIRAWVGLYDAAGTPVRVSADLPVSVAVTVAEECDKILTRGVSAASVVPVGAAAFTLQTLGHGGHLRGVLAIASDSLDAETRSVVTTVIAMAGFALEQDAALADSRSTLRAGVVRALLTGDTELASEIADAAWGGFPADPVLVALTDAEPDTLVAHLELRATRDHGLFFFGRDPQGGLALVVPADAASGRARENSNTQDFQALVDRFDLTIGVAQPGALAAFPAALAEARFARQRGTGVVNFAEVAAGGAREMLSDGARDLARAVLAPLVRHDREHDTALVETLRVWLLHDARFEEAAASLGVHRHTVRSRIRLAERLLGSNLSGFSARAEIWVALLAVR